MAEPEFDSIKAQVEFLRALASDRREDVHLVARGAETVATFGERHGSWTLSLRWQREGLDREASFAITNPTPSPDHLATTAVMNARASASNDEQYASEYVYSSRRSVLRVRGSMVIEWLESAVRRADDFTTTSLNASYYTPIDQPGTST